MNHATEILIAHRIGYKYTVAGKNLPELIKIAKNLGKYGVIVFEDYNSYLNMDPWNRDLLDKYCVSYSVGIIAFVPAEKKPFEDFKFKDKSRKISDLPLANSRTDLTSLEIKQNASILHMTKSGVSHNSDSDLNKIAGIWVTLTSNSSNYETIALGHFKDSIGQYFL